MQQSQNPNPGTKLTAIIHRLREQLGPDVDIRHYARIMTDTPPLQPRLGVEIMLPDNAVRPGMSARIIVFLDELPSDCTVQEFADYVVGLYQSHLGPCPAGSSEELYGWYTRQQLLENTLLRAVNPKLLASQLENTAHFSFRDLAGEYMILSENRLQLVAMPREVQTSMNLTDEELLDAARRNTLRELGIVVDNFDHYVSRLRNETESEAPPFEEVTIDRSDFYTVSNRYGTFGTALLLIPEALEALGKKVGMDYLALPTGIHAFQIIRDDGTFSNEDLKSTVSISYQFACLEGPEEALTDSVYRYSCETKTLSIV